jgi:hypothetical protein
MKKYFVVVALIFVIVPTHAKNYKGAEYRTKESFLYGRFESSFKVAGKEGTLGTMFTYFDGTATDTWSSGKWNEIDVEIMGRYSNDVQYNTITPGQANHVRHQYVNFNPAIDYHTYAIEWTPEYVAWFIDGTEVYKQTDNFVKTLTHPQKLMFNTWIPNYPNWAGQWSEKVLPAFTSYDWAAYYQYTPGNGNAGTNYNFTLGWRDEFNSFDASRWEKATHTFDGNNCDFVQENATFSNGKLILCLTFPTELGYNDKRAPSLISVRALSENKIQIFFSEEIDKASSENTSLYVLSGTPVKKATLQTDNRTIILDVDPLDLKSLPVLILTSGIKDLFGNVMSASSKSIIAPSGLSFPLKINVGGASGIGYLTDREFVTDTSSYGFMEGSKGGPFSWAISNTDDDVVYQSEINGMAKYVVRIPNGLYRIKLLFAENYFTQSNKRIFDVYVQGKQVVNALDIYKESGSRTALIKTIENVVVNNFVLDIHFAALLERALLNGIIIEQLSTGIEDHSVIPNKIQLYQNYPNPFNPDTFIRYSLTSPGFTSLKVYNLLGKEIATLVNENKQPGNYKSQFSSKNSQLPSGIYFYQLVVGNYSETKKMSIMK